MNIDLKEVVSMNDYILEKFFEHERWEKAIDKGVDKGINKTQLRSLCCAETRIKLLNNIKNSSYEIMPPYVALIPKDDGTNREVYVNQGIDRVVLSIANDLLFDLMPEMIHKSCKSYQKGIGTGNIVKESSQIIANAKGETIGWKSDLSKYFDSVPVEFIDNAFDKVEYKYGKSKLIDVLRKYYHNNFYFDMELNLCEKYQSLKQGASTASWLADCVLYHIDEILSSLDGYYVRYSDDMLFVGNDYIKAMNILSSELNKMNMKLNPKKVEYLSSNKWFKFLGFNIRGNQITLSASRTKDLVNEIYNGIKNCHSATQAINKINKILYKGNGKYSWGTSCLPIINVKRDISTLNSFFMDCIRIASINSNKKRKIKMKEIGGIGIEMNHSDYTMIRGKGSRVGTATSRTDKNIDGYLSLNCMIKNINTSRALYNTLVMSM